MNADKSALITGASGDIGAAIALALAAKGWDLALHYASGERSAQAVAEACRAEGAEVALFQADLCREEERVRLAAEVAARFPRLFALVNNAGCSARGLFQELSDAALHALFELNFFAAYRLSALLAPGLIARRRGAILNVASIWALAGASCEAAYAASKAALLSLSKSLARELGPSGIRVNCLCPGVIEGRMNAFLSVAERAQLGEEAALGRLGRPEEVGRAAAFLLDDEAAFVTGQALTVDGGFLP